MNANMRMICFEAPGGARLVLRRMNIEGVLHNAFAVIELSQVYRNDEQVNLEAVYSFPLPVEAVLLHLSVRLDERLLLGRVAARAQAEAEYEQALAQGDTAVMLEQVEPGYYTMNVGNLLPGESAEVRMRYALPLKWVGEELRLALPTTIAPRYGNARNAGVQPHQAAAPGLLVEHRYGLSLTLKGQMGRAQAASPTHRLAARSTGDGLQLGFADGEAAADRDLVLNLRLAEDTSSLTAVRHGEELLAHAVFRIPSHPATGPLSLKLLVDCSGSMAGDSMRLARNGALHALGQLRQGDLYAVCAFGSQVRYDESVNRLLQPGSAAALAGTSAFVQRLDAKLGGTEMLGALNAAFALRRCADGRAVEGGDVLLITDGESWDRAALVRAARASGHRIFVIGVGSSPAELLVRQVAEATGGAAEFVSPNEDVLPVIERQLARMRVPRIGQAHLELPGSVIWHTPARLEQAVFPGDTLHLFCALRGDAAGTARLALRYAGGEAQELAAPLRQETDGIAADDLVRIAAAARIAEGLLEPQPRTAELAALAEQHQLMSPYTNYILVHLRGEDAAQDMPELRQVPSMLAAGWGGTGSVVERGMRLGNAAIRYRRAAAAAPMAGEAAPAGMVMMSDHGPALFEASAKKPAAPSTPRKLIERINQAYPLFSPKQHYVETLDARGGLIESGLPDELVEALRLLMTQGWAEEEVVLAFWTALLALPVSTHFSRGHRRALLQVSRRLRAADQLTAWISGALATIDDARWNWKPLAPAPAQGAPA